MLGCTTNLPRQSTARDFTVKWKSEVNKNYTFSHQCIHSYCQSVQFWYFWSLCPPPCDHQFDKGSNKKSQCRFCVFLKGSKLLFVFLNPFFHKFFCILACFYYREAEPCAYFFFAILWTTKTIVWGHFSTLQFLPWEILLIKKLEIKKLQWFMESFFKL